MLGACSPRCGCMSSLAPATSCRKKRRRKSPTSCWITSPLSAHSEGLGGLGEAHQGCRHLGVEFPDPVGGAHIGQHTRPTGGAAGRAYPAPLAEEPEAGPPPAPSRQRRG